MEDSGSRSTGSLVMSEHDRQRRSPGIRSVLGTFSFVFATAGATVLCVLLWFGRSTMSADPNRPVDKQPDTAHGLDNAWSTVSDSATEWRPSENGYTAGDVEQHSVNRNLTKEASAIDQDNQSLTQGISMSGRSRIPIRNVPDRQAMGHRSQTINRQVDWNAAAAAAAAADKWTTEQDGWTVYQDVYESGGSNAGADYGGGGYQQPGNSHVDGIELTTEPIDYRPYGGWWPQGRPVAASDRPTASADQNRGRPETVAIAADPQGADPKTTAAAIQNGTAVIDWRALGIVALVKFALFALKTFAVVNAAMLLLFNVALAFLKFQLLVKSAKFVGAVAVSLPLLLTTSLFSPVLVSSVLSIPARVLQLLTTPMAVVPAAAPEPNLSSVPTPGSPMPGSPMPTRQPTRPSSGTAPSNRLWQFSLPTLAHQFEYPDPPYERRHELKQSRDPAEMVFRKLMDSEKCVERIACRMALAERVGIVPYWMRWIIDGVSKAIPNEKLESYFKTYDDVNNTIKSNVSASDNWATWCLEHYNCSSGTNLTTIRNTKK